MSRVAIPGVSFTRRQRCTAVLAAADEAGAKFAHHEPATAFMAQRL